MLISAALYNKVVIQLQQSDWRDWRYVVIDFTMSNISQVQWLAMTLMIYITNITSNYFV